MSGPAEVIAAIAGLGGQPPAEGGPLTPQVLIDAYCQAPADEASRVGSWCSEQRADSMFNAGFCGYDGRQGFDDGHDWISELTESGWRPLPELGEWPLVAFAFWPALPSDPRWAIAHYCEGDIAIEVFNDSMWQIELTAGSPRAAAEQALAVQRDPRSDALVFDISTDGEPPVRVDLADTDDTGHKTTAGNQP